MKGNDRMLMKCGKVNREGRTDAGAMFTKEQLRKLILPLIVEQVLAITVGMADTMMIS